MHHELSRAALIGLDKTILSPKTLRGLAALGVDVEDDPVEVTIAGAAIAFQMNRGGFLIADWEGVAPVAAPENERPVCPTATWWYLESILQGRFRNCLLEFLHLCERRRRSLPPEHLPEIFVRARYNEPLAGALAPLIGNRDQWLIRQNGNWAFLLRGLDADGVKSGRGIPLEHYWRAGDDVEVFLDAAKELIAIININYAPTSAQNTRELFMNFGTACPVELEQTVADIFARIVNPVLWKWACEALDIIGFRRKMALAF